MGKGEIKIPIIGLSVEQPFEPQGLMMNFTAALTDGDGDVATDAFSIDVGIEPTITSHDFLLSM